MKQVRRTTGSHELAAGALLVGYSAHWQLWLCTLQPTVTSLVLNISTPKVAAVAVTSTDSEPDLDTSVITDYLKSMFARIEEKPTLERNYGERGSYDHDDDY
jgi:hypothetical protein